MIHVLMPAACPFPSPQGSQVYIRGMARALHRRGIRLTLLCYGHGVGPDDDAYTVLRLPSPPGYRRLRSGPDLVKPWLDVLLALKLRGMRADLVHAQNYEAGLAAAWADRGTPLVYNSHGMLETELPAYFSRGRRALRACGRWLDRRLCGADAVVALSAQGVAPLERAGARRIWLCPPGLDPDDFAGVRPQRVGLGPYVVYAGNTDAYQDLGLLYAAMARLPDWRLLLISPTGVDGPVPERTVVYPRADWATTRALIAGADVAVIPRQVCPGFPMKLLNSLALGVPTVVSPGAAQGLPGEVLAPRPTPSAWAEAILRAYAHPRDFAEAVVSTCNWTDRAIALESHYQELLSFR